MENDKVIKMPIFTKIGYSIFNLFAPMIAGMMFHLSFDSSMREPRLCHVFVILGVLLFFFNLYQYGRYFIIRDNKILVARGSENSPNIISTIDINEVKLSDVTTKSVLGLFVSYKGEKIKLISTYPSFTCLVLMFPIITMIMIVLCAGVQKKNMDTVLKLFNNDIGLKFFDMPEKLEKLCTGLFGIFLLLFGILGIYVYIQILNLPMK